MKVQWPDRESEHEADALSAWSGHGAVTLLEYDPERRALLIERCIPGTPLSRQAPALALEVMIGLLPRLWIPAPPSIRSLSEEVDHWLDSLPRGLERSSGQDDPAVIDQTVAAMRELVTTQGTQVLVNQDLHADNVLRALREPWLVIDPKPLRGEREFGIASIVRGAELGHSRAAVLGRLYRLCDALNLKSRTGPAMDDCANARLDAV